MRLSGCVPFCAALLLFCAPLAVKAQGFCGAALTACDVQQDTQCLERTLACGAYDTVLATLFVEDAAPTLDQKYAIGASFFGNHIRERSRGRSCEMVVFGRDYLREYLGAVDTAFRETGQFGALRQMRQIYQATQMLSELDAVQGCPESALTRARVQAIARAEAVRFARDVFLAPPDAVVDAFGTLQLALRGFVSKASDLETGIALREIEIESAARHLGLIRVLFDEVFGAVSGEGHGISVDSAILDDLVADNAARLRRVEIRESAFATALGGVGPEEYADIRTQTVSNAQAFLKASAFHINMIGVLLPTDPARPFPQVEEAVNAETPARAARDQMAQIREDWRALGAQSGLCAQSGAADRVWFCR